MLKWLTSTEPRTLTNEEARAAFPSAAWLDSIEGWDDDELPPSVHVIDGAITFKNSIVAPDESFHVVIKGDISAATSAADIVLDSGAMLDTRLLVVMGNVKARHFIVRRGVIVRIEGNLELSGYCFADHGSQDGGGWLHVEGDVTARGVLNDKSTDVIINGALHAPVLAGMIHVRSDLVREEHDLSFVESVMEEHEDEDQPAIDLERASALALRGEPFLIR